MAEDRGKSPESPVAEPPGNPGGSGTAPASAAFTPPLPRAKQGGSHYHKPGCQCMACTRRGRTPKAKPGRDGDAPGKGTVEILYSEPETIKAFAATGNSARDRVAQWIYYRASEPGITNAEIARRLGLAPATLNSILYRARTAGWLQIDDPLARVEVELLPQVVDNLSYFLSPEQRDKHPKVTIEAAKGILYPIWKESQGIEENKVQVLGIKIEMPPGGDAPARGVIHGAPRNVTVPRLAETATDAVFESDDDKDPL